MRVTTRGGGKNGFQITSSDEERISPLFIRPSYRMTYVPMYMSIVGTAKATKEDANFLPDAVATDSPTREGECK